MTIKSNKTLDTEMDDRWRRKGHGHITHPHYEPIVCNNCKGIGYIITTEVTVICPVCQGTGEL